MAKLKNLGVMIDVSRNAVMNMYSLKRFLTLLKKMGYNCAMLYTEDPLAFSNVSMTITVGAQRGDTV